LRLQIYNKVLFAQVFLEENNMKHLTFT